MVVLSGQKLIANFRIPLAPKWFLLSEVAGGSNSLFNKDTYTSQLGMSQQNITD